jgi:RNA polymerase sigma-70 factor (ECF subfamily)
MPQAALQALFDEGKKSWPRLALSFEAFARHVGKRASGELPRAAHAGDLYLACACAAGVPGAVQEFDRAHLADVKGFLSRLRPSDAFVDEVRQALREKLFVGAAGGQGRIVEYSGDGALASWVRVTAVRAAIDLRRQNRPPPSRGGLAEDGGPPLDAELANLKQRYRKAFNDAFRRALATLDDEPRALLRRHYLEGATLEGIAASLGVHRATAARRLASIRLSVLDEARRLLQEKLGATPTELESLVRVMRSQIDLTLSSILQTRR